MKYENCRCMWNFYAKKEVASLSIFSQSKFLAAISDAENKRYVAIADLMNTFAQKHIEFDMH